ncbi:MAG: alpha/beta hydrolase [Opitutales bacterium]|jgi:acetyl esterase/lipase|nr:alpha/beta hydrolase [bacterium]MDG2166363.1 alpha/beta hydrolase [Opitutales bacterium]
MRQVIPLLAIFLIPVLGHSGEREKFIYKTVGDTEIELYVTHSEKTDSPSPAIVWYYGSGLNKREEPNQFYEQGKILAKMGITSVYTNIRGAVKGEAKDEALVIRCIEDAKSAFRWVRAHAEVFNLDQERIAVGGGSSGGFLSIAIVNLPGYDAKTDDTQIPLKPSLQILFNPGLGLNNPEHLSPFKHIKKGAPPAVIFQGNADTTTPLAGAFDYQRTLDKVGTECHIFTYKDQGHGFFNYRDGSNPYYYKTVGDMIVFLEEHGYIDK